MAIAIVSALYVAAQVLADISSLRILFVLGMSIDGGTFIYPITFTLRDLLHKTAGVQTARAIIVVAAVVNILMALLFGLVSALPADTEVGPQVEFSQVLAPVWRIVFASIVAEVFSELIDTEAYQLWVTKVSKKHQWARVLISNAVSVPVDSILFCWLAFGGVLPSAVVWSIVLANIVVKGIVTVVSIPTIYLVKENRACVV